MIYDNNHDSDLGGPAEIAGAWFIAIGLVGLVLIVLGLFV